MKHKIKHQIGDNVIIIAIDRHPAAQVIDFYESEPGRIRYRVNFKDQHEPGRHGFFDHWQLIPVSVYNSPLYWAMNEKA